MSESYRTSDSTDVEESWRVRLLRTQDRAGRPLGAGVLLPGGLVLTCAHTVVPPQGASGGGAPLGTVYVDVPGAAFGRGTREPLRARLLDEYLVPPAAQSGGDLALLKLDHEPDASPAVLHRQIPVRGERVHFTGYPEDLPGGEHLEARLMGRGGPAPTPEWVQLDPHGAAYPVRHGYSGSGVVHSRSRRVIGIVAHRHGTPQAPVRGDHAYLIPTETVLRHLPLERLGLTVRGPRAVSRDVALDPGRTASGRVPGLQRRLTRWLDGAPDTDPVEPVFAGEGDRGLLHTVRSVLTLADREQSPADPPPSGVSSASQGEPRAGSIDFAVDATNRTAAELARQAAERIGLPAADEDEDEDAAEDRAEDGDGQGQGNAEGADPRARLLGRLAAEHTPLTAAFLAVDRSASPDGEIVDLLRALLTGGGTRLLLVFSDPHAPLFARVREELMEPGWEARTTRRITARISRLAGTELRLHRLPGDAAARSSRPHARAAALRRELRRAGETSTPAGAGAAPELFRLAVEVEAALLEAENAEGAFAGPMGAREFVVEPPGGELTDLPVVAVRDPAALVGPGAAAGAAPLAAGDLLHQQYEVVGPLGHGSHGQVFLARDLLLEMRPVALKGLLDPGDRAAVRQARQERLRLVSLNHPAIIRVVNYARHGGGTPGGTGGGQPADYIVMEFADGARLAWVAARIARQDAPFAGPRVREFIVVYGLLVLDAFSYLHEHEKLVYGDLSLTNVLHCGNGIKLIDVAGVREPGAPGPVTHRPPETGAGGEMTTAGDLYTVGAVLGALLAEDPEPPADLGTESLQRALRRATAADPRLRYASAREMRVQLQGVLRELRSLRLGEETFEPSSLFAPAASALSGRLGAAPPLERWAADAGTGGRAPDARVPEPARAAVALPVPKPDKQDPNWKELQRTSYSDAAGLLQLSEDWEPSPELHLLRCRLRLELSGWRGRDGEDELRRAARSLADARRLLGSRASYDWRLDWHQGLVELARGRPARALICFDDVYAAIPGEYAPKLALGYCHERLAGDPGDGPDGTPRREAHEDEAMRYYDAVWRRNHALGTAAFGLARIQLARHRPDQALASLAGVPPDSRHRTAARTAMVRIHAGAPPTVESARRALSAAHRLVSHEGLTDGRAQERLATELQELLLDLVRAAREKGADDPLPPVRAGLLAPFPVPATERELRRQLSDSYRRLAKQVPHPEDGPGAALAEALLDSAFRTRPLGFRHRGAGLLPRRRAPRPPDAAP
ncbi:tetratricopeptide repeat protein [Streptomyces zhihengii]